MMTQWLAPYYTSVQDKLIWGIAAVIVIAAAAFIAWQLDPRRQKRAERERQRRIRAELFAILEHEIHGVDPVAALQRNLRREHHRMDDNGAVR